MSYGATLTSSPAKSIYVYRNGDTNFQCKKVVVNPRQVKNWDAFIELITARVKARNGGAVRRVFTPTGRTTVSDLTNIENNHFYVAAGAEGFKRHQYNKISALSPQKTRLSTDPLDPAVKLPPIIKPVQHSRLKVSARCKRAAIAVGSKVIYVFRNGDANSPAVKILFTKFMLKNYDVVLNEVTRKVNIMTGAVWKLHSLDGKQLLGPEEFEDHEFYVACGRENFKKVPYPKEGVIVSPRVLRPTQVRKRITRLSKDSKSSKDSKTSKESKASKPAQTDQKRKVAKPSKPSKPTPPKIKKEKSPEQKEAEEVFHHKPTMVKRSREREPQKEGVLDYGDDPEGVFKAKEERNETKGAAEVQETVETAIDLPIDQVAAEEVEEEEDLDLEKDDEAPAANQEPTPEPPKLEPVNLVDRMLEDDEVPEEVPEDAPPAVDDNNGVVGGDDSDDKGGVNGSGGDGDDVGGEKEKQTGQAEEEEKKEEEQPNAFLTDDLGENTNDEPAGFYSKRSPVTSKISPIIAAADDEPPASPSASNGGAQSPNENNSNSAENRDVPLENRDDQVIETAGSPEHSAKQESLPAVSPTKSIGRVQTPNENNNKSALSRENSSHSREGVSRISPHPPASKRSVPPSPAASNRRSVTPKENPSNKADSRPQSQSGEVANPAPSPQPLSSERAPSAEQLQNGQAQSPVENNTPRPVSGDDQNVEATLTPHPPPSPAASNAQAQLPIENVISRPASRDAPSESGGDQVIDSAPSPQQPAFERIPSPAGSSGPAQSPTKGTSSRPESTHAPLESEPVQGANSSASPNPPPSEPNNPASPVGKNEPSQTPVNGDVPPESGGDQVSDSADTKDNEASPPEKDVENAADAVPREGEVAA